MAQYYVSGFSPANIRTLARNMFGENNFLKYLCNDETDVKLYVQNFEGAEKIGEYFHKITGTKHFIQITYVE